MPNADILGFMSQQAPMPLSEQRQRRQADLAQTQTSIEQNMLQNEIARMGIDKEQKKRNLLETFQGDVMGQQFQEAMMRVDPDMVIKMQESLAKLSKEQKAAVTGRMEAAAKMALADDTPEKWQARGWPPQAKFENREEIIMSGASMSEALGREKEVYSRSNVKPSKETKSDVEVRLSEWLSDPRNKRHLNTDQGIKYRKWLDELQKTSGNEKIRRQIANELENYEANLGQGGGVTTGAPPPPPKTGKKNYVDLF